MHIQDDKLRKDNIQPVSVIWISKPYEPFLNDTRLLESFCKLFGEPIGILS